MSNSSTPACSRNRLALLSVASGVLLMSCSGGGGPPAVITPPPTGYVLTQTRLDPRTLAFELRRTADEPLMGLSFDLLFPPGFSGIVVGEKSLGTLLASGTVGVGVDDEDPQRVVVAAGKAGVDTVRGDGVLLTFRLGFATGIPVGLGPQAQNVRCFRGATSGEFSDEFQSSMPLSVVVAP